MSAANDEIHALIQARTYDFLGFIQARGSEIDGHILSCETCCQRMRGWAVHLPRHFARVVVELPERWKNAGHTERLRQLKKGQCLPCGCEVLDTTWSREEARETFFRVFARVMNMPYDDAVLLSELTRFQDLPLGVVQLRRLRDAFWIPDGSLTSEDGRDREEGERVPQLPDTVGAFISRIVQMHTGMSYSECSDHWSP